MEYYKKRLKIEEIRGKLAKFKKKCFKIFIITNTMHTIGVDKITLFKTT